MAEALLEDICLGGRWWSCLLQSLLDRKHFGVGRGRHLWLVCACFKYTMARCTDFWQHCLFVSFKYNLGFVLVPSDVEALDAGAEDSDSIWERDLGCVSGFLVFCRFVKGYENVPELFRVQLDSQSPPKTQQSFLELLVCERSTAANGESVRSNSASLLSATCIPHVRYLVIWW